MKFDEKYPDAIVTEEFLFEGSAIFKAPTAYPCWHCGELTAWVDINFEANLCSEECERAKWSEYFSATSS